MQWVSSKQKGERERERRMAFWTVNGQSCISCHYLDGCLVHWYRQKLTKTEHHENALEYYRAEHYTDTHTWHEKCILENIPFGFSTMCIEHRRRRRWLPIPPPSSEMNDIYYIGMAQESLVFDVRPRKRRESLVEMEIAVHLTFARLLLQTEMNSFCLPLAFSLSFLLAISQST